MSRLIDCKFAKSYFVLGERYKCRPACFGSYEENHNFKKRMVEGTLAYVHPNMRFVTLEFDVPNNNKISECFMPNEVFKRGGK